MPPLNHHGLDILTKLAKFIVVGSSGVVVNSATLFVLYQIAGLHLVTASALAVELAIVNNYIWNNRWTFGKDGVSMIAFAKFNLVSLGGLAITTGTLYALVVFTGLNYLLANLIGISLATLWNFALNFKWTWGEDG